MTSEIEISIIIPTISRRECVTTCLDNLEAMENVCFEVLVIEQGNIDDLEDHFIRRLNVRWLVCSLPNASLARNIGLREAKGGIVLFLDDDVSIENKEFLRNHLRHYENPAVSGVYGQVLEVGELPTAHDLPELMEMDWGWMKLPPNYGRSCLTRNGGSGNLSVRRKWALSVGGMDAWFEKGARREETEFNLRYTKRYGPFVFDPHAGLTHLSAGGGSRTWGHVRRIVPMHHIVGHWYFLLRTIGDRTLGARGLLLELRHIAIALLKNPQVGYNPVDFLRNAGRAAWGFSIAVVCLLRGPRRIDTLSASNYREIRAERAVR